MSRSAIPDLEVWQRGFIKDGKLIPSDKNLHKGVLVFYNEQDVEFCIRKKRVYTSLKTHAYYRGVIIPVCESSELFGGWSHIKIHEFFASMFLKDVTIMEVGKNSYMVEKILSTSSISQKRMNKFIDEVRQWLAEHNVQTPDPQNQ